MRTDDPSVERAASPFEARLRDGLQHLAATTPVGEPGAFDPDTSPVELDERRPSSVRPVLVAAAAAAVVVAGLVVITTRVGAPARSDEPASTAPAGTALVPASTQAAASTVMAVELAPPGAMVFPATPAALEGATVLASDQFAPGAPTMVDEHVVRRWYSATLDRPEAAAHLSVESMPADQVAPDVVDTATTVTVQASTRRSTTPRTGRAAR